ncbi:hypothetical protein Dsin_017563 [Dipteronia sinensis]|uniref:HAT C-terminal dimerisation domain-containing protein n=1 Tax=Dipteronia sinensis TaxID=43782 RepID=A0AAE0E6U7_9ROSI|nr:hypothetical protein Dsin_017563 [Dipteronia sinensis]
MEWITSLTYQSLPIWLLCSLLRSSFTTCFSCRYPKKCMRYDIEMPNMSARYMEGTRRSCQQKNNITVLVESRRSGHFFLIDRLIRLVLTLPVSTATTERAFSAMNLLKTPLRSKMENDFLANCLVVYIEREFADSIDMDSIIDEFDEKPRRCRFH